MQSASGGADVSVVVPVYNHERYVGAALESALAQVPPPRELICIDDGSTDGSFRVVSALAARHPAIRCWSRENRGAAATLNEAIAAAQGRYLAILNSDDVYLPGRLARSVAALEEEGAQVACSAATFLDSAGRALENRWYQEARESWEGGDGDLGAALIEANFLLSTSNIVARRQAFDELGGFDDLRYAHDLDWLLRALSRRGRIALISAPLFSYRLHGANTISESPVEVRVEIAAAAACYAARLGRPAALWRLFAACRPLAIGRAFALALTRARLGRAAQNEGPPASALLSDEAFRARLREAAQRG